MNVYFIGAIALTLTVSRVIAEEIKNFAGVIIDVNKTVIQNVLVADNSDNTRIFTPHETYAIEKVVDGDYVIAKFNLDTQAPRSLSMYFRDEGTYVVITIEPALNKVFKRTDTEWVKLSFAKFQENVLMKDMGKITFDLDNYDELPSVPYGYGKKYTFSELHKRVSKIVLSNKVILSGDYEIVMELEFFVRGYTKVARVVYVYKPDDRIKEVFYRRTNEDWVRVKVKTAAKLISAIEPFSSDDYKTIYDGFYTRGILTSVTVVTLAVLY